LLVKTKILRSITYRSDSGSQCEKHIPFVSDSRILVINHVLSVITHYAIHSDLRDQKTMKLQTKLLEHPVCRQLAKLKWKEFGLWIFITGFLSYTIFLGLFTWAALRNIEPAKFYDAVNVSYGDIYSNRDSQTCRSVYEKLNNRSIEEIQELDHRKDTTDYVLKYLLYILLWIHVVKGLLLIFGVYRLKFRGHFYAEVVALILCFVFLVDNWDWQRDTRLRCFDQWQSGAFGLFLGWATLLGYIRFIPYFGLYVIMLEVIVIKFLWFAPVLIILICSFAFSFFMLLSNQAPFQNIGFGWIRSGQFIIFYMIIDFLIR
jgi:hypothetical protein